MLSVDFILFSVLHLLRATSMSMTTRLSSIAFLCVWDPSRSDTSSAIVECARFRVPITVALYYNIRTHACSVIPIISPPLSHRKRTQSRCRKRVSGPPTTIRVQRGFSLAARAIFATVCIRSCYACEMGRKWRKTGRTKCPRCSTQLQKVGPHFRSKTVSM